jgi:uncharacterized membrane protein YuzA (DUF378 family)
MSNALYIDKMIHLVVICFVLLGGLNCLSLLYLKNDMICYLLGNGYITKLFYLLIGISTLYVFFDRSTYLPFLGDTVLPCAAFAIRIPDDSSKEVIITTIPSTKVIYWAAEPRIDTSSNQVASWEEAYGSYANSGVVMSDESGKAVLRFRGPPQAYKVPFKGVLKPHVHFRICEQNGIIGPVQTYFINDGTIEKMSNYI